METHRTASPDDARRALEDLDRNRRSLARRLVAPWWYHVGAAACTAGLFVGTGLITAPGSEDSSLGVLVTVTLGAVGPSVLLAALKRATGVSVDRYASGMAAYYVVVFGLFAAALLVQTVGGLGFALPAAGAVAFVVTLLTERRIDARLRERVLTDAPAVRP